MIRRRWSRGAARVAAALAGVLLAAGVNGCAMTPGSSESSTYLIVDSLLGAAGSTKTTFSHVLASDVLTTTKDGTEPLPYPTRFEDPGQVSLRLSLKDSTSPIGPTTINSVTINHYRVVYTRVDGFNEPGVNVPVPFESSITATVTSAGTTANFIIVQASAKEQMPLVGLVGTPTELATIAVVTFSGFDQAGRAVSVTAQMGVNFADWGG